MSDTRTRAIEIYQQHIALAATDGRLFRKIVMEQIMSECNVSRPSAATHYNNAKKSNPVEGLGRPTVTKGARKIVVGKGKVQDIIPDEECYTVLELEGEDQSVSRTQSFDLQGDASESFDKKIVAWPRTTWVLVKGLGPNPGETFALDEGEQEVKRYSPVKETA